MDLKFSELRDIGFENVKKIFVTDGDGEPLRIITEKCKSYGVRKSEIYDSSKSLSMVLGENALKKLTECVSEIEKRLDVELSSVFYWSNGNSVYPKIRENSVFYGDDNETIDPFEKFERKACDVKAVLEIEGVIVKEEKYSLQLKIYEAKIYKKKHVRLLDLD